jgi:hypothetical protein
MIISHKHKFIFIKPTKVAGTSIEVSLAKHCDKKDIITPITKFDKSSDEDKYSHPARNYKGFYNHIPPSEIKEKIDKKIWENYYKFTVVRNPWDQAISRFYWDKIESNKPLSKLITPESIAYNLFRPQAYILVLKKLFNIKDKPKSFENFIADFNKEWTNTRYYFGNDGKPLCDFYIRYENLDKDYKKVCKHLDIPYKELPRLKTKLRKETRHYSEYYNEKTRYMVANIFEKEIAFFKYKFLKK